jgi:hypothetical protein
MPLMLSRSATEAVLTSTAAWAIKAKLVAAMAKSFLSMVSSPEVPLRAWAVAAGVTAKAWR